MLKRCIFLVLASISFNVNAQNIVKTMFYNLLEFPEASPGARDIILGNILDEYEPDIFMVCELQDLDGANSILGTSLNDDGNDYLSAPFVLNESSTSPLQQLLYYRASMFTLENTEIIQTTIRDINHYTLKLNTLDEPTNPVRIEIYISHLKSSQGNDNEALRLDMVNAFTSTLQDLDPNAFVIFAGDLNVYTSQEDAYQELLDETNPITLADPINTPGNWHNNDSFQDVHTQSTRISSAQFGAGAGGGLDDRFDFILVSENMLTNPDLKYIPDTYKAFGNNGNCYNNDISSSDCDGPFGINLRSRLFSMSDHLPVVMELETDEVIVLNGTDFEANEIAISLENTIVFDDLQLRVSSEFSENLILNLYNSLGQNMGNYNFQNNKNIRLHVSHLPEGIYFLQSNVPNSKPLKFLKAS